MEKNISFNEINNLAVMPQKKDSKRKKGELEYDFFNENRREKDITKTVKPECIFLSHLMEEMENEEESTPEVSSEEEEEEIEIEIEDDYDFFNDRKR